MGLLFGTRGKWLLCCLFQASLILIVAVDSYFRSNLIEIPPEVRFSVTSASHFKRVIVVVADGFRRDDFYSAVAHDYLPAFSKVMESDHVAWGAVRTVSRTMSLPSHLAIFAGIYPSFVQVFNTYWLKSQLSPFFESPFQFVNYSAAVCSDEYIPYLSQGVDHKRSQFESHGGDSHVPAATRDFLQSHRATTNKNETVLLFIAFTSPDTLAHELMPHTEEFFQGLRPFNDAFESALKTVSTYFPDNETLYLFTADHGMTSWGKHGEDSFDERDVPFLLWGSEYIKPGRLAEPINQVDLSLIISAALGTPFPSNAQGHFVSKVWTDVNFVHDTLVTNLRQLETLLSVKANLEVASSLLLDMFPGYSLDQSTLVHQFQNSSASQSASVEELDSAIDLVLNKLQKYDDLDKWLVETLLAIGQMFLVLLILSENARFLCHFTEEDEREGVVSQRRRFCYLVIIISSIGFTGSLGLLIGLATLSKGLLMTLDVYMFLLVCRRWRLFGIYLVTFSRRTWFVVILYAVGLSLVTSSLHKNQDMAHKERLAPCLLVTFVYYAICHTSSGRNKLIHLVASIGVASFLWLRIPNELEGPDNQLRMFGAVLSLVLGIVGARLCANAPTQIQEKRVLKLQVWIHALLSILMPFQEEHFSGAVQYIPWTCIPLNILVLPILSSRVESPVSKIIFFYLPISTVVNYLSISYEGIFLTLFCIHLLIISKTDVSHSHHDQHIKELSWAEFFELPSFVCSTHLDLEMEQQFKKSENSRAQNTHFKKLFWNSWLLTLFLVLAVNGSYDIYSMGRVWYMIPRVVILPSTYRFQCVLILIIFKVAAPIILCLYIFYTLILAGHRRDIGRICILLLLQFLIWVIC